MLVMVLAALAALWLTTVVVVLGLCASAARGDRHDRRRARGGAHRFARQTFPARSTCRTVLSSSLMSAQSDQPATYR